MSFRALAVSTAGPLGAIELDRPQKLNALSSTLLRELAVAARSFDERPEVKVVVVSGRGRAFSAGADLAGFGGAAGDAAPAAGDEPDATALSPRHAADLGRLAAEAIESMRAVTIARIHGHCVGGAVVLAAACDLRVAAADAVFSIPEVDLGIPLAWGGIPRLVREIGPALTKELVLTCRPFGAEEARAAGFLNRVVSPEALPEETDALAAALAEKSALTLSATKRHVNAVTEGMVGAARSWSDADGLLAAWRDPESQAAARRYAERMRARRGE